MARLYSEDVRKLEAKHAGRLSPGSLTWAEAIEALYNKMSATGPVKGAALIGRTIDYLCNVDDDEVAHFMLATHRGSRAALMILATFSYGPHPNRRVQEEGLGIELHIIQCSRSRPRCATGIPVAFVSKHALNRLYERGHDITEKRHATSIFAFIGVLGYLTNRCPQHADGGMSLLFSDLLVVGALHRVMKTASSGRLLEETFLDIRTVLPADEAGPSKQPQIEQGRIAAEVAIEWFRTAPDDDLDEPALARRIPYLPRREDSYPVTAAR